METNRFGPRTGRFAQAARPIGGAWIAGLSHASLLHMAPVMENRYDTLAYVVSDPVAGMAV
jgi:hypothetical protein